MRHGALVSIAPVVWHRGLVSRNKRDDGAEVGVPCSQGVFQAARTPRRAMIWEHIPSAPLDVDRLTQVGPLRVYPGGYSITRSMGDLSCPFLICAPEARQAGRPLPNAICLRVLSDVAHARSAAAQEMLIFRLRR